MLDDWRREVIFGPSWETVGESGNAMLLTGTFVRTVDEKLRVAIPKSLKAALEEAGEGPLYMTPGTDGSLAVYPQQALSSLAERLAAASPAGQDVRAFSRMFYSRAQSVEIDGQGRIRIPPELATLASIEKDAVLVGVQDHLELWDRRRWETYLAEKQPHFDQIAEAAFVSGKKPVS
jgi:MraZ protein